MGLVCLLLLSLTIGPFGRSWRERGCGSLFVGARLEHRHGGINPHPDEWSVFVLVSPDPNAVKAPACHKRIAIRYDVVHDCLQSIHTRVLTEPQAPRSEELFFGWG